MFQFQLFQFMSLLIKMQRRIQDYCNIQGAALCENSEWLSAVNYYHKQLQPECCSSYRSTSKVYLIPLMKLLDLQTIFDLDILLSLESIRTFISYLNFTPFYFLPLKKFLDFLQKKSLFNLVLYHFCVIQFTLLFISILH